MSKRNTLEVHAGPNAPIYRVERDFDNDNGGWVISTRQGARLIMETVAETAEDSVRAFEEDCHHALDLLLIELVGAPQRKEQL